MLHGCCWCAIIMMITDDVSDEAIVSTHINLSHSSAACSNYSFQSCWFGFTRAVLYCSLCMQISVYIRHSIVRGYCSQNGPIFNNDSQCTILLLLLLLHRHHHHPFYMSSRPVKQNDKTSWIFYMPFHCEWKLVEFPFYSDVCDVFHYINVISTND